MLRLMAKEASFWWAMGLVVCTPVAVILLGELLAQFRRRQHPLAGTITAMRNVLLPCAATYLMVVFVAGVDRDSVAVRILLTLLAIGILHVVLSLFNVLLFAQAAQDSWQARTPKLVRDLARFGLVVVGSGLALSTVWQIDLGNVLAALGVGSIVLGLALQEPLGNLFSGLMLTFEQPFRVGDWIQVGDKVGEVVEVNWRAVHILTPAMELQIIPNSSLAKNNFGNFSRPTRLFADTFELAFASSEPPNRVKELLLQVMASTPGVLDRPTPMVRTARCDASTIQYRITFHVADFSQVSNVRDEVLTRIWYAARRESLDGLAPHSSSAAHLSEEALRPFRQFGLGDVEVIASETGTRSVARYARGEQVTVEGQPFAGLYLILAGDATVTVRDLSGHEQTIAELHRGDFFGEKSLLSCQTSDVTVTARSDLEVLVLNSVQLHALLERTPRLAREIGQVMETRRQAIQHVRGRGVGFKLVS